MNVWWMLRDVVGETALHAALHSYKAADDKDAYYMQKVIEVQAHRDLAWFFNDWVYRDRGLPDFRIVSVYPRPLLGGGYMVTVLVENLGEAAAEVPVTLHMTGKEKPPNASWSPENPKPRCESRPGPCPRKSP